MRSIDQLLVALALVRIGQELGSQSPLAHAVHDVLVALARLFTH